ncbi:TPA: hypothetical protein DIS57_02675 [Candidatus Wolfebacteria bacterium]|uniref:Uncharacterized protein n=1 Tax=Candidatus Wolfebacteria bacterium GW2011_GWB1_47_1 TaxID=1619007 RepID=A0A0G4ATH6_9BACT|nr:MAG: hypothetical protein UX70_C0001G0322 [Candidatus Wolfebacteria bacterium GW2011_GWB1_47_1]HAL24288.1 hypothetical protein [Candidatus Wolfebacteria bacterium]HCM52836.1 hypothetical protein [Candidatus Wolfebacteria bacterium]
MIAGKAPALANKSFLTAIGERDRVAIDIINKRIGENGGYICHQKCLIFCRECVTVRPRSFRGSAVTAP